MEEAEGDKIVLLLQGAFAARDKVGLKMNLPEERLADLVRALPALRNPTIAKLATEGWIAVDHHRRARGAGDHPATQGDGRGRHHRVSAQQGGALNHRCPAVPEKAARLRRKTVKFPVPDFVCEILSDSTARRDRGVKFEDYEAHGVREYWIVNPDRRELEQYVLEKSRYTLRMKSRTGEVASVAIKGFRAPLAAFFDSKANLAALRRMLA